MSRWTCLLGVSALALASRLPAQERDSVARRTSHVAARSRATWDVKRATIHWGKWLVAGSAVALTVMGAHEHDHSNRDFSRLLALCRANNADCLLGPDGRYRDATAEQLYQSSLYFDRRARVRLLVGQASLLAAAGLFIADLTRHGGGPGNKPFHPLEVSGDARAGVARVGLRVTF